MHSRIYELSEKPVRETERFGFTDVPEWFFSQIADYADDTNEVSRENEIQWFQSFFGDLCTVDGDKLTFDPDTVGKRLRKRYDIFLEKAEALKNHSYEAFCGKTGAPALELALFELNDAYEDRYGFYVYEPECCSLQTVYAWLRDADLSKPYYVGGIVDYHW